VLAPMAMRGRQVMVADSLRTHSQPKGAIMRAHAINAVVAVLQCDGCDKPVEGDLSEEYVWNRAKAESWETRQVSGRWVHLCPYCASPGND
jgi:hypothetical protein